MPVSLTLLLTAGVLIACGVYLMLERTLTRIILGYVVFGNGVNLLFIIAAGVPGAPPFEGTGDPREMTDPLPFAMVLTAIVISLGITALGVALAYRAWQLFGHDEVPDDVEDRRVLRRRRQRNEGAADLPWHQALTEESRRGALASSQGLLPPENDDPLGGDLTGAEDVPHDDTEADAEEDPLPPRTRRALRTGAIPTTTGAIPTTSSGTATGATPAVPGADGQDPRSAAAAPGTGPATDPGHRPPGTAEPIDEHTRHADEGRGDR